MSPGQKQIARARRAARRAVVKLDAEIDATRRHLEALVTERAALAPLASPRPMGGHPLPAAWAYEQLGDRFSVGQVASMIPAQMLGVTLARWVRAGRARRLRRGLYVKRRRAA